MTMYDSRGRLSDLWPTSLTKPLAINVAIYVELTSHNQYHIIDGFDTVTFRIHADYGWDLYNDSWLIENI